MPNKLEFKDKFSVKDVLSRLWVYLSKYKLRFFISIAATVISIVGSTLYPFILGLIITELTNNTLDIMAGVAGAAINYPAIFNYLIVLVIVFIVEAISLFFSSYLMAAVVQDSMYDLRQDISKKTNSIPVSYFDSNLLGDIMSRTTNDVDSVSNALQQAIIFGLMSVLSVIFAIVMMFILYWKMAIIIIIAMLIAVVASRFITSKSQPIFDRQQDALGDLFGYSQEQLSAYTEVQAYNQQDEAIEQFKQRNEQLFTFGSRSAFLSSILTPVSNVIFNGAYVVTVLLGGLQVISGTMTVGSLQSFLSYIGQVTQPINRLTQLVGMIQSAYSASNRIFDYLDEDEEIQGEVNETLPDNVRGHVVFDHVKFGYSEDNILMNDVSFEVLPGQTAAIVGPTGAGKTTLINLLMRFYDVLEGAIRVDGIDIKSITREDLRKHMGMVLQDAWLFSGSVKDNIRLGDIEASDYEVRQAAQVANVDNFILTLPGGYDMEINDDGSNVSQGQRQLMTIARAIISDPDILILDEATSSVDTRLEHLIQDAMDKVMEGRTSFVIAHRLSTIRNADIILVMNQGTIIESGNHDELIAKNGFYADLYNSQFNREDPADIHMSF